MKKNLILIALSSVIGLTACKKEKDTLNQTPVAVKIKDSIYAKINGKSWPGNESYYIAGGGNGTLGKFNICVTIGEKQFLYINNISISSPQTGIDTTQSAGHATFLLLTNGNLVNNSYVVWREAPIPNQIFIDSFDTKTKRVKGRFNLSMYRSDPYNRSVLYGFADTLRFTDGYFNYRIDFE